MSKKLKNILLFIIMIISVVGIVFTINYARNNLTINNAPQMGEMGEAPPDMNRNGGPQDGNNGQPPEKPAGGMGGTPPDMNNGNMGGFSSIIHQ